MVLRIIMGEPAGFNSPRPPRGSGAGGEGILIHLIPESSWFATLPSLRRRETQGVFIPLHPRIFARWSVGVLLFPHPLQGSRLFEVDPLTPQPPRPLNAGEGEFGFVGAANHHGRTSRLTPLARHVGAGLGVRGSRFYCQWGSRLTSVLLLIWPSPR